MLKQLGTYKDKIVSILCNSVDIKKLILGETYDETLADLLLKKYIKGYLSVTETTPATDSYICVETTIPKSNTTTISMVVTIWAFCHKDIMDYNENGRAGIRTDILSELIEESLLTKENINKFGIGALRLDSISLMEPQKLHYGRVLQFSISDFR